jgi:flagellar biosynthesis/type III secretory pathway M-ring protein FliF/YscJ
VAIVDPRHVHPRDHLDQLSDGMKIVAGIALALVIAFAVFAVLFVAIAEL